MADGQPSSSASLLEEGLPLSAPAAASAPAAPDAPAASSRSGFLAALFAFTVWGLVPIYWKMITFVPALEIICHRVVWSVAVTAVFLTFTRRWRETLAAVRSGRTRLLLLASGTLVGLNWLGFIWAVTHGRVLETSLGYYITPLVNALFGVLFFRDRLRRPQVLAVALAAAGVMVLVLGYGRVPWVALFLALTFGSYGLVRKIVAIGPLPGLFCETLAVSPLAAGYLAWLAATGQTHFGAHGPATDAILAGAGLITSVPLIAFAHGARSLRLTTVGMLQYLAPTLTFLLGVFAYHEPFTPAHAAAFGCIWAGVAIYTLDGLRALRPVTRA